MHIELEQMLPEPEDRRPEQRQKSELFSSLDLARLCFGFSFTRDADTD